MPVNAPHSAAKATIVGSDCVRVGGDAIVAGMEGLFCPRRWRNAIVAGIERWFCPQRGENAIVAGMEGLFCPRFTVPMQERCRKQQNTTNPTNYFHRAGAEMTTADKLFARFVGFVYRFVGIVYRFVGFVCRNS